MSKVKKPSLLVSIIGMAVILTVIFVVLFSGASAINDDNIKRHLDRFADFVAAGDSTGHTGKFSYGDVTINGFGFNKTATISNVSLEMTEKSPIDTPKWSFSTAKMDVLPDPLAPGKLYFVFTDPINVIENSQLKTTITSSTPIKYSFNDGKKDGSPLFTHAVHLPSEIIFTPGKPVGDSSKPNRTVITMGESPRLVEQYAPDGGSREAEVSVVNIKVATDEGAETSIGSVTGKYTENAAENNQVQGQFNWLISNISGPGKEEKDGKPFSISGDVAYHGDRMTVQLGSLAPSFGNTEFTVNKLALFNDDFKLLGNGKVSVATDDPLAYGNLDIAIDNAGQFVSSYLVPDIAKGVLLAAFQKVSGQPVDATTHVNIPLKRDKNGVTYIGDATFESLAASLAAEAFRAPPILPPDAVQPVLPPAENPTLPPVNAPTSPTVVPPADNSSAPAAPPVTVPTTLAPESVTAPSTPESVTAPATPPAPDSASVPPAAPAAPPAASVPQQPVPAAEVPKAQ